MAEDPPALTMKMKKLAGVIPVYVWIGGGCSPERSFAGSTGGDGEASFGNGPTEWGGAKTAEQR